MSSPLPSVPPPGINVTASPPPPPTNYSTLSPSSLPQTPPTAAAPNGSVPAAPGGLPPGTVAGMVLGTVFGAVMVLIGVGIFVIFYRRKKRKEAERLSATGGQPKEDFYTRPAQFGKQNTPPDNNKVTMLPVPTPPPGVVSNPQMLAPMGPTHLESLDSDKPFPSLSPGISFGFSHSTFTYEELGRATDGFSQANLLGQGGFGYVHKGVLPDGKLVAIKQLKAGSGQGEREFRAEIEIISRIHHRHLVSLVGYCITGANRMLVYEFIPNNTLEFHLHGKGRPTMSWSTRMKIAIGSAKGLAYLHEDCHPRIIHRDVKAANILLDDSFEAKVADFGLAKSSLDTDTHVSTRVMGTFGYMAPEYASSGKLTDKSDVFSFGVVLLELITGRRPVDRTRSLYDDSIVEWARPLLKNVLDNGNYDALVDPKLQKDYDASEMRRMISCAAACTRHSARLRPRMGQVVRALEGNMPLDELSEGVAPGHSMVYSYESSDYNSSQYEEDLKKFRKMALETQDIGSSGYSVPTSEFGQNPSTSSTEGQQTTQEMESCVIEKNIKDSHERSDNGQQTTQEMESHITEGNIEDSGESSDYSVEMN